VDDVELLELEEELPELDDELLELEDKEPDEFELLEDELLELEEEELEEDLPPQAASKQIIERPMANRCIRIICLMKMIG
jgi:hypothetical protein